MARKRDLLFNNGGTMRTVAPFFITQTYENDQWVGRKIPIQKGWQKKNGVMVPIFDNDPSGPPLTKRTFEATVDTSRSGNNVRSGYHSARRYAGTNANDAPMGYLWTTSVPQVLSAVISRILNTTGGGQGGNLSASLYVMLDDRTINPDGSTTINWGITDVKLTFTNSTTGAVMVVERDVVPAAIIEATSTSGQWPAKFGELRIAVDDDFMPSFFGSDSRLKIEFNTKVP